MNALADVVWTAPAATANTTTLAWIGFALAVALALGVGFWVGTWNARRHNRREAGR